MEFLIISAHEFDNLKFVFGELLVCSPCMKKREISEDTLIEGAKPAGGATLVEWLSEGSPCVCY